MQRLSIRKIRRRHTNARQVQLRVLRMERGHPLRILHARRVQQHGLNHAEDRRIRAHTQSQRQNRHNREGRRPEKLPHRKPQVFKHSCIPPCSQLIRSIETGCSLINTVIFASKHIAITSASKYKGFLKHPHSRLGVSPRVPLASFAFFSASFAFVFPSRQIPRQSLKNAKIEKETPCPPRPKTKARPSPSPCPEESTPPPSPHSCAPRATPSSASPSSSGTSAASPATRACPKPSRAAAAALMTSTMPAT